MLKRSFGLALCTAVLIAGPVQAQHWETPTFFSPRPHSDLGVYITKPENGDVGVQGIWRQSAGINLGVRGGIGGDSDDRAVLIGAELFGPIELQGADPVAIYWVTGIGASFNGVTSLRIPAGASVGLRLGPEGGFVLVPYVHPRVTFDLVTFEIADETETETEFDVDVDIGADLELAGRWVLRAGYKVGGNDVFGFGLAFRMGRGAEVR